MSYAGAGALLDHLQVVLEAESSRSCADGTEDLDVESVFLHATITQTLSGICCCFAVKRDQC